MSYVIIFCFIIIKEWALFACGLCVEFYSERYKNNEKMDYYLSSNQGFMVWDEIVQDSDSHLESK